LKFGCCGRPEALRLLTGAAAERASAHRTTDKDWRSLFAFSVGGPTNSIAMPAS
jgi:hypothetical protein